MADSDMAQSGHPRSLKFWLGLGGLLVVVGFILNFGGTDLFKGSITRFAGESFENFCGRLQENGTSWHGEENTCEYKEIQYAEAQEQELATAVDTDIFHDFCSSIFGAEWRPAVPAGMPNHCFLPPSYRYFNKDTLETAINNLQQACEEAEEAVWVDSEKQCFYDGKSFYNFNDLNKAVTFGPLRDLCQTKEAENKATWNENDGTCFYKEFGADGSTVDRLDLLERYIDIAEVLKPLCLSIRNAVWNENFTCNWGGIEQIGSGKNLATNIDRIYQECLVAEGGEWLNDEKACRYEGQTYYNENSLRDVSLVATMRTLCGRANGAFNEADAGCTVFDRTFAVGRDSNEIGLREITQKLDFINFCRSIGGGAWDFRSSPMYCALEDIERFDTLDTLQVYIAEVENLCGQTKEGVWDNQEKSCRIQDSTYFRRSPIQEIVASDGEAPEQEDQARQAALDAEVNRRLAEEAAAREARLAAPAEEEVAVAERRVPAAPAAQAPGVVASAPAGGGGGGGGGRGAPVSVSAPASTQPAKIQVKKDVAAEKKIPVSAKSSTSPAAIKKLEATIKSLEKKLAVEKSSAKKKNLKKEISSLKKQLKTPNKKVKVAAKKGKAKLLKGSLGDIFQGKFDELDIGLITFIAGIIILVIAGTYFIRRKKPILRDH